MTSVEYGDELMNIPSRLRDGMEHDLAKPLQATESGEIPCFGRKNVFEKVSGASEQASFKTQILVAWPTISYPTFLMFNRIPPREPQVKPPSLPPPGPTLRSSTPPKNRMPSARIRPLPDTASAAVSLHQRHPVLCTALRSMHCQHHQQTLTSAASIRILLHHDTTHVNV